MPRRKTDPRPQGRQSAFSGVKLEFLESYKDQWLASNDRGSLYTLITKEFLSRFGYELAFEENPGDGDAAPSPLELDSSMSSEEQAEVVNKREEIYRLLRAKLACWYRHRYTVKNTNQAYINKIIDRISSVSVSRPRKKTPIGTYSKIYWKNKLKPQFDLVWNSVKVNMQPEDRIRMWNDFIKASWEKENECIRNEVLKQTEDENNSAIAEWKSRAVFSGTAEGYDEAWKTAETVLPTFADAISEWLGATVMILAVSPLGSEGGEIAMQSAHSDTSKGMTKRIMPEYDPDGFTKIQDMMLKYGKAYFSPEECLRRVVKSDKLFKMDDEIESAVDETDLPPELEDHVESSDLSLGPHMTPPDPVKSSHTANSVESIVPDPVESTVPVTSSGGVPPVKLSTGTPSDDVGSPRVADGSGHIGQTVPPVTGTASSNYVQDSFDCVEPTVPPVKLSTAVPSSDYVGLPPIAVPGPVRLPPIQSFDQPGNLLDIPSVTNAHNLPTNNFNFEGVDWSMIQPLSPRSLQKINEPILNDNDWFSLFLGQQSSATLEVPEAQVSQTYPVLTPILPILGNAAAPTTTTPLTPAPAYPTYALSVPPTPNTAVAHVVPNPPAYSPVLSAIQPTEDPKALEGSGAMGKENDGAVVGINGEKGMVSNRKRKADSTAMEGGDAPKQKKATIVSPRPGRTRNLPDRLKEGGYRPPKKGARTLKN